MLLLKASAHQQIFNSKTCFKYIPPRIFCQQKRPEKKKKAMENFHRFAGRFAGASCLTRTGDTLINSQVL